MLLETFTPERMAGRMDAAGSLRRENRKRKQEQVCECVRMRHGCVRMCEGEAWLCEVV